MIQLFQEEGLVPLPRSRYLILLEIWGIGWTVGLFSILMNNWILLPIVLSLCMLSLIIPRSIPITIRTQIYSVTGAIVLSGIIYLTAKFNDKHFFFGVTFVVIFLIIQATLLLFLDQRILTASAFIGCILLSMAFLGTTFSIPRGSIWLKFPYPFNNVYILYLLTLGLQAYTVFTLPQVVLQFQSNRRWYSWRYQLLYAILSSLATLSIFFLGWGIFRLSPRIFALLSRHQLHNYRQYLESRLLRLRGFSQQTSIDYPQKLKQDPANNLPALYIHTPFSVVPEYFRVIGYRFYSAGRGIWEFVPDYQPVVTYEEEKGRSTIRWGNHDHKKKDVYVFLGPGFAPEFLYLPSNLSTLSLIGEQIFRSTDGTWKVEGWDALAGYTFQLSPNLERMMDLLAFPLPKDPTDDYLQVPSSLVSALRQKAWEICGSTLDPEKDIYKIQQYLLTQFQYTLEIPPPPNGVDPVIHFLFQSRKGHCALFASAAVLLCRVRGIPARYVTGFFVWENMNPQKNLYVARFRDAHAWVEVWSERKGWVALEVTPPEGLPSSTSSMLGGWERWKHQLIFWIRYVLAVLKRGEVAVWIYRGLAIFWSWFITYWYGFLLVGGIVCYFLIRLIRRSRSWDSLTFHPITPEHDQAYKLLLRIIRYIGIQDTPSTTIREIIRHLQKQNYQRGYDSWIGLLEHYEKIRFGESLNQPQLFAWWSQQALNLLKQQQPPRLEKRDQNVRSFTK